MHLSIPRLRPLLGLGVLLSGAALGAEFKLGPLFTDGMVVQRGQAVPVWGKGEPDAAVEVSLGGRKRSTRVDAGGRWQVSFDALPVGGPYLLEAKCGDRTLTAADVLSGDVWLCSGQSNMQMPLRETLGANRALAEAPQRKSLHLFRVPLKSAPEPATEIESAWTTTTSEAVRDFSAVAYYFGESLGENPALAGVPVGLIESAFGGTPVEAWIPHAAVADLKPEDTCSVPFEAGTSAMYNAMIHPLAPAGLKGVLWYQGESNAGKSPLYEGLLNTMIGEWRGVFGNPKLPFFLVQLPAWDGRIDGYGFTWVREAESKVAAADDHVGLAVTIDTHDGSNLHPPEKQEIGRRLALLALRDVYGAKVAAEGPVFTGAEVVGDTIRVSFDTGGRGLASRNPEELQGFAVAGADGGFVFAGARIDGDRVIVRSDEVPEPRTVRYAWGRVPSADLMTPDGLPASPFRTDAEAPTKAVGFVPQPRSYLMQMPDYELVVDGKGRVTSLGVKGRQFVSNALGLDGATSIPSWFGGRTLFNVRLLGPDRIKCSDNSVSLVIDCDDHGMSWTVANTEEGGIAFRLALTPQVEASREGDAVVLRRGDAMVKVDGPVELEEANENGRMLTLKVDGKSTATLSFSGL